MGDKSNPLTRIKCEAKNCVYHCCDDDCAASAIQVGCCDADCKEQTNCGTFEKKNGMTFG